MFRVKNGLKSKQIIPWKPWCQQFRAYVRLCDNIKNVSMLELFHLDTEAPGDLLEKPLEIFCS